MTCPRHDTLNLDGECEMCDREADARFDIAMHCPSDGVAVWLIEEIETGEVGRAVR